MACDHCFRFRLMMGGLIIGGTLSASASVTMIGGLILNGSIEWTV